ncbi:hypothetical protein BRC76_05595 [Halobacteriales archaeon QH_8_67_36]|nr:MAG: hypothetical protein BRC76_05595 [Halobacteriales archaeon QH_8_67_36]
MDEGSESAAPARSHGPGDEGLDALDCPTCDAALDRPVATCPECGEQLVSDAVADLLDGQLDATFDSGPERTPRWAVVLTGLALGIARSGTGRLAPAGRRPLAAPEPQCSALARPLSRGRWHRCRRARRRVRRGVARVAGRHRQRWARRCDARAPGDVRAPAGPPRRGLGGPTGPRRTRAASRANRYRA